MTKNSIKNYFIISLLLLSASSISQSNVFATPSTIDLGTASNFTVLAATTVTNTGNTVIAGNLGLNPGTSITGFPPGIVTGATNTADLTATQAQTDAITAYGALSRAACTTNESPVADIGGKTLSPGVYCFPSSSTITGTLTLSGSGVYIFKMGSTLVTAAGPDSSNVVLTHGATANNVFWQVGSSATLGTYSGFEGTIIALTSITANTGATVDGRLIALNGAVTLDSNTITVSSHTMADLTNTIPSHATADTTSSAPSYTMSYATSPTPSYTMADTIPSNFPCTVTFPTGAIDLGSNVQYPAKVYPPGVYCIDGAANIGSGPITLTGIGAHIFEINGALNQAANTDVILANGAQASSVIWVPTGAITIGANSHLIGTVNGAPITIGANSDINGIGPVKIMADTIPSNFPCTVTFPTGAIDLGSNVQYPAKVYPPGVYCIDGAANIGSGPITLTGIGAHIFEINGALNQAANTDVILANGAQASSVIWVPTGAITIGANSHLIGTVNGAPITIGANSDIDGVGPMIMADTIPSNFPCTVTFPTGAIDLGSNVQYPAKVYPPGVYCIDGAANIGSGPITLTGIGAHIFEINGALNQAANTDVILANGSLISNVSWTPTGAITIGANSNLIGTVNGAPITIGANSDIDGVGPMIMADATSGNFAILTSTYTNTSPGTSIAGDLGYTTGPAVAPTIDGITHVADSVYTQAGITQNAATSYANSQACTTNLGTTVDLSLVQGGVYAPGVYCTTGAASIGTAGITLTGNGAHIFKINGALTTVANSTVRLSNGAQVSSVTWVPTGATTLGANSNFAGTILDASGVTIGNTVSMTGRVLAFGGTVSTNSDIIAVPSYTMADTIPSNFPCTVTFPTGAIDLGSNVQYPAKVYPPGVYCIDGAANIGSGPITLTGIGAHIFEINGALNQAANTDVILANGAQASSVIWVPTGAITIGANSHLIGTVNGAPITIGANSDINGIGPKVMADTIPGNFAILTSTYTNTSPGTSIAGDLGYTTGPAVAPTIDGITHVADSVYTQAGITQNAATSYANSQACTTNLGTTVDLSLVQGGVYAPGVYCTTGAASIGTAGITLSGNGVYIFEINGALTTVVHSAVTLSNGAQASSVTWVPTGATTLGANSNFAGTILDASGVTIGNTVSMTGRVLAFGGTVSTDSDTITVPSHTMADTISTVPEFGAITALIFTVAIVSIIAVSVKTRLRIMPKY